MNEGHQKKNIYRVLIAFLIPTLILTFVYYRLDIIPFGEKSLLTIDLKNQYISYFSYFKNSLLGKDSLLYSFSKTLSGNMVGLVGYYLISPFNILFLFTGVANFTLVITIITLLKTGSAAVAMFIYMKSKNVEGLVLYITSTAYALSGYMVIYEQNIMWLDAVILLPIVVMGIDNLFDKKNKYLYIISFSFLMITNYYIGFMVAIFLVLYFIGTTIEFIYNKKGNYKDLTMFFVNFSLSSLLAGGISSITWLPSLLSYSGSSKVNFDLYELLNLDKNFTLIEFLSKFINGSTNRSQIPNGLPNIYVPATLLILVLLFLVNSKINMGEKLKYTFLTFTMFISFKYVGLNMIWHGFSEPTWFPYRNSFIFIFLIICITGLQFKKMSLTAPKILFASVVSFFILNRINQANLEHINESNIMFTSIILILTICLLSLIINKKVSKPLVYLGLLLLVIMDVNSNSHLALKDMGYYNAKEYTSFVQKNEPLTDKYKPDKNDFYRIEKTFSYSENDALLLNYSGLSHYSSNETDDVKQFVGDMGYLNSGNWAVYSNGSSWLSDSLLGVKFILSDNNPRNYLNVIEENEGITIYENPYAFPLGFLMNNYEQKNNTQNMNPFEYQNEMIKSILTEEDTYKEISQEQIKTTIINLDYELIDNHHIFSKKNEEEDAYLLIDLVGVEKSSQVNIYLWDNRMYDPGELYFDNQYYGEVVNMYENNIYTHTPQSENLQIKIKVKNNKLKFENLYLYSNEIKEIENLYNLAESNKLEINEFYPTKITGTVPINEEDRELFLSIPFDEGWLAKVDGKEVETFKVNNVLLGVKIPQNGENIELTFSPKGLKLSIFISIISIIIVLITFYMKKSNKFV